MTAKEYLSQISDAKKRIEEKKAEIAILWSMATSISANLSNDIKVQTSSANKSKTEDLVLKIVEREDELLAMISDYMNREKIVSAQIDGMEKPRHREALHWRYICGYTFEKVGDAMNYSTKQAIRIHGYALKAFEEKYLIKCP